MGVGACEEDKNSIKRKNWQKLPPERGSFHSCKPERVGGVRIYIQCECMTSVSKEILWASEVYQGGKAVGLVLGKRG